MNRIVILNGKEFTWEEIKNGTFSDITDATEKSVLDFCQQWLNGTKEFYLTTSGSTGIPKQLLVSACNMKRSALMTAKAIGLETGMRALVCLNTDFIAGKMMLVRGLEIGMDLIITAPSSNPLQSFPKDIPFDFTALVPLQAETILKNDPGKKQILDGMKAILIGGAAINVELEALLQQVHAEVYHTFGMTETLSHIALRKINGKDKQDYYTILDDISISQDERNCLIIKSPFTEETLVTNDVVELLDDKRFKWIGRADFLINSGGIKIYPERIEKEIEKVLFELTTSVRFFITAVNDQKLGQAVGLVIESKQWEETQIELFKKRLMERINKYEMPKHYFFIDKFEETGSGKIDRRKTMIDGRFKNTKGLPN